MTLIRTTRFTTDPARADEMIARRAELIAAVRAATPGPVEARLTRVDEHTWLDIWRWESPADLEAAAALAHDLPAAASAFELAKDPVVEQAELVDER
jgi:quinol monooxygenase YgiN